MRGLSLLLLLLLSGCTRPPVEVASETLEHTTPVYSVDAIYPSMEGPEYTNEDLMLVQGQPELLWITGYEAVMVGPDGAEPRSQNFMCHNTLSIHRGLDQHRQLFKAPAYGTRRLFTLSQGQHAIEFPPGFAIPLVSAERLMLQSQVLNLNESDIGKKVRHKIKTHYVKDRELQSPMVPLCMFPSGISVPTVDPNARELPFDPKQLGCAISASGPVTHAGDGLDFTGHWVVPPGRETRRSTLKQQFPFDTRVHYIAIHVHPYAESFEFRDKVADRTLFKADCRQIEQGVGLERIEHYSSVEGIPVQQDHDYELVVTYNNTSQKDQTAMAFMFFYVEDTLFHKPGTRDLARSEESFCQTVSDPSMLR